MRLKFFVIGSCFSGYMFKEKILGEYTNGCIDLVHQHQHDSFISIMTEGININLTNVKSKYQWDFDHFAEVIFNKSLLDIIEEKKPDYLVIDSYAEAVVPLIKLNNLRPNEPPVRRK